jgi:hypothetical protein
MKVQRKLAIVSTIAVTFIALMKMQRELTIAFTIAVTFIASTTLAHAQTLPLPEWKFGLGTKIAGVAVAVITVVAIAILAWISRTKESFIFSQRPKFFFCLGIAYTVLLLLGAIAYNISYTGTQPYLIAGILPIAVPWFGALGAVTISLEGVFTWSESRWNPDYNYWHCGRPVFGAVLGAISFYLFVLIIMSAGTTPKFLDATPTGAAQAVPPKDFIIYYVVAFLVGYREETFRELIRRVTDLILKPGAPAAATSPQITFKQSGIAQTEIKFVDTKANSTSALTIEIVNSGGASVSSPVLTVKEADAASKDVFKITKNDLTGRSELKSNESITVEITFAPATAGKYSAALSVAGTNLAAPATIGVVGTASAA